MMNKASLLLSVLALTLLAAPAVSRGQATGTVTTLYSFTGADTVTPNTLILGRDGNFYGTTEAGGTANTGTVYKITPAGVLTTLYNFGALNGSFENADGAEPTAGLIQGSDGNFYGTASRGGSKGQGTVFKVTAAGALTTLHTFTDMGTDGSFPQDSLVQGSDGNFYGTTTSGGSNNGDGTFFKITPAGVLTTLYNYSDAYSDNFYGSALILGSDGNFYGTTEDTGVDEYGSVFKITPAGVLTTLHQFIGGTDGEGPRAALVKGSDGSFYGTTYGISEVIGEYGTVFKITSAGVFTLLHHFTGSNTDGADPSAPLVQAKDGNFYGTTAYGGSDEFGTVFQVTPAGVTTTVYSFTGLGADGAYPQTGLFEGSDGSLYGTTQYGGSNDAGAIFKLTLLPTVTSARTATATVGTAFTYPITATNHPTAFGVQGLPAGLTVNSATGLISGTPKAAGTATLTLNVYNPFGKGSATVTLTIKAATGVVTSAPTATATVGKAFSYQITATNGPTSFGVQGLPAGFAVDTKTGMLTGTPKAAGKVNLTVNAYNAAGKGSAALTLTIAAN